MLLAMGAIFVAHMAEIVVFAVGYLVLHRYERFGDFAGEAAKPENFGEYLYFSTMTYTSLGLRRRLSHRRVAHGGRHRIADRPAADRLERLLHLSADGRSVAAAWRQTPSLDGICRCN